MIQSIEDSRREAGDRSIADKIVKRLHDLEKTVENNQGRWAWELLQNAKDSIAEDDSRTVSVQIQLDEKSVEFRHNGTHFTDADVVGLISQISSKEVEEGQQTKKTGRFGTGFLTTHLLSRVIKIKGILEAADRSFYEFEFLLDRRGRTTTQLMPRIASSWKHFRESIKGINTNYDKDRFNTSFCYQLETEEQKKIAKIGVEEFSKLIPFVLAFVHKIKKVEIIDNITKNTTSFERRKELTDDFIFHISQIKNGKEADILILCVSNEKVAIASNVERIERGYLIKSVKSFPKLFCDFPLIGTENFHFPVIVNSFFFNPQTERDGIWLKGSDDVEVEENQQLLENAIGLYQELVSKIAEEDFFDLHNIVETKIPSTDGRYFDEEWYEESIQEPVRNFIYSAKIVELEDETFEKRAIKDLWFPRKVFPEAIREKIWQFVFDLAPHAVCRKAHLHSWCNISWDGWKTVDYRVLVNSLVKQENINHLGLTLGKSEQDTFEWLNSFGEFVLNDESNLILFEKTPVVPNRNEVFKKKVDLYIDAVQDDELIYVLALLGEDWKEILLHENVSFIREHLKEKEKSDIAVRITETLNRELKKPLYDNNANLVKAISLLSEWFENNPGQGQELFSEMYRKRAEIFMNTIRDKESLYRVMRTCTDLSKLADVAKIIEDDSTIIEKIQEVKELTSLLEEFKADDISDLKNMLRLAQNVLADDSNKIEITQETLLSLGVTSISELEEALRDKGIAAQFTHKSTPTVEMFLAVQKLIERSKVNVINHLKSLSAYDCSELEELATTVLGGIKKDGLPIYVVVRPSDNGEVIIYYSSEKDALDTSNAELWIDNGVAKPKKLTLGKILKTTGINRIPV